MAVAARLLPLVRIGTLSRPYSATFLLALLGVHLVRSDRFGGGLVLVIVGLVLLDDAYGLALALALAAAALARCPRWKSRVLVCGGLVVGAVTAAGLGQTPNDYGGPRLGFRGLADPLIALPHAIFPTPEVQTRFWNTWMIDRLGNAAVAGVGIGVLLFAAWLLRRDRGSLVMWIVGSILTMAVLAFTGQCAARFAGTFFTLVVMVCWLDRDVSRSRPGQVGTALLVVAIFGIPASVIATAETAAHPFSEAVAAGAAIRYLPGTVVAAPDDVSGPAAIEAQRALYYPIPGRWGTYTIWDRSRTCRGNRCPEGIEQAAGLAAARNAAHDGPAFLLLNEPLTRPERGVHLRQAFTGSVVGDETYWLYTVSDPIAPAVASSVANPTVAQTQERWRKRS